MIEKMAGADPHELLLGRGTDEIFAAHWPYNEGPIADHLNSARKDVASTTLAGVEWNNSTLIAGDLADYVKARKRERGPELQVHGSPGLTQMLLEHDLIDEFRIRTFPVVLGAGKRPLGDGAIPMALRLVDSSVSKTGVTISTYARTGEIEIGEMDSRSRPRPNSNDADGSLRGKRQAVSEVPNRLAGPRSRPSQALPFATNAGHGLAAAQSDSRHAAAMTEVDGGIQVLVPSRSRCPVSRPLAERISRPAVAALVRTVAVLALALRPGAGSGREAWVAERASRPSPGQLVRGVGEGCV